jgi:hypothetical protein
VASLIYYFIYFLTLFLRILMKTLLSLLVVPTLALSMDSPPSVMKGFEGCGAIIIPNSRISAPSKMGRIGALVNRNGFSIIKEGEETPVNHHDVGPILRKANKEQLLHLLKNNKLRITRYNNNEYKLELANDLKGGGPITAGILYGTTKVVCYTGAAIGIGCAANSIMRRMGAEEGSVRATVGGSVVSLASGAATGGLPRGAELAAAAVNGGLAQNPAVEDAISDGMVGGASIALSGGVAAAGGFAGAVETVACAMGAIGMWLPLP